MGIGQATSLRLAEAGAGVFIADIDIEAAEKTAREIEAIGGSSQAIQVDASSAVDARKGVLAIANTFGKLDILVNNAGIYPISPALKTSEDLWNRVHEINLKGLFLYSQAVARQMVEVGNGGKIINIASVNAIHPQTGQSHYGASKSGVIMLTRSLALEFARHNILVNAVAPGLILTPGFETMVDSFPPSDRPLEEKIAAPLARIPLNRMGNPDDIAKVILFLASSAADYMTGSTILVDGGYLLS
ncbi:SDR family NAD(P)-dependent oxidoreductase [Chloroflexota bacterium]